MRDRHRRSFWTLLWEGFKENWWLRPRPFDVHKEQGSVAAALREATSPESFDESVVRMNELAYHVWKQYPITHNDANWLTDRLVDEEMIAVEDLPV